MARNTPQLWDEIWKGPVSEAEDVFNLAREEHSIRWQRIERMIQQEFGAFEGLRCIEIGAGAGTNAALMAKRGALVTILDYSEAALRRAGEFFVRNGLPAEMVRQNALSLPPEMLNRYDVSMSFGLTEHFRGAERLQINKAHFDVLRPGGIAFISVPNQYNPPYRLFKFVAERTGTWKVGEEYPYSRKELSELCRQIGVSDFSFFGDNVFWSLNFVSPLKVFRKLFKVKPNYSLSRLKKDKGTPLDAYLAYALVLCGKK